MILDNLLENLKQNKDAVLALHAEALEILAKSGVLEVLRERARPIIHRQDSPETAGLLAAKSAGYFECLEDLRNFREVFLSDRAMDSPAVAMEYGALTMAVNKGDLTEEEAHGIRANWTAR